MPPSRWNDRRLARRVAAGDSGACSTLVRLHHAKVYGLLACLCRDAHQAEDLTQETFLACWRKIDSYRGDSSLSAWLHGIAYRKFIDSCRAAKAEIDRSDRGGDIEQAKTSSPDPLQQAADSETAAKLAGVVSELDPQERAVVVMHYFESMSLSEVSAALECPAGTVKWRLSKALKQMREMMERHEDEQANAKSGESAKSPAGARH